MKLKEILKFYQLIMQNGIANCSDGSTIQASVEAFVQYLCNHNLANHSQIEQLEGLAKATPLLLLMHGCEDLVNMGIDDNRENTARRTNFEKTLSYPTSSSSTSYCDSPRDERTC